MLLPGKCLNAVAKSPYSAVYYALSVQRLNFPSQTVMYDRRTRYGGVSSQNVFNLIAHGFVGLLVFHETVLARTFVMLLGSIVFFSLTSCFALFVKFIVEKALPGWTALFFTVNYGFMVFIVAMLIVIASMSMTFKLSGFYLSKLESDGDRDKIKA